MGDLSAEPSMEEILSSIKRIIAEEGDGTPARPRRQTRAAAVPLPPAAEEPIDEAEPEDEVLELSDPMPIARPEPVAQPDPARQPRPTPTPTPTPTPVADLPAEPTVAPIISDRAAAASRGALDQLSRLMIKPEPGSDGSLEGLVRDMLRPLLRDWLDANLPALVETMVAKEIRRITGQGGA